VIRAMLATWGLALLPIVAFAAPPQSLAIVLGSGEASTQRLEHYQSTRPIAVRVAGPAVTFDRLTLTASGPDGTAVRTALVRTGDGFAGSLRLRTPGTWTLALTTQLGTFSSNVANVALDVVPPAGVPALAVGLFVLAALMSAAGMTLLVSGDARRSFVLATIRS
jgi:hypothetical protein